VNSYLDHYCERVNAQLWGEPFNVLSNLAILAVAILIIHLLNRARLSACRPWWELWLLSGFIVTIAAGSSIWHLFATSWTLWADRIPILIFISIFIVSCLIRVLNLAPLSAVLVFTLFQIINIGVQTQLPAGTLNGSIFYLPTLALLIVITVVFWQKNYTPIKHHFLIASLVFAVAVTLRSIDIAVCSKFPVGTHFAWHLLVAATIYLLISGLISHCQSSLQNAE